MKVMPKITFGAIVLNNHPFTREYLRALYPFAHQIIVVEGATPFARHTARPDGHSSDGTLEVLRDFQKTEDPEHKVLVVTAEDEGHTDGFWPGEKDEMSQAYARRATGDWLWQVDGDEFYREEDIAKVMEWLSREDGLTAVSFHQKTFWGSPDYYVDGPFMRGKETGGEYHRLFRWGSGYRYTTHRPPTVIDEQGRDLRTVKWMDSRATAGHGILLYHYSLLFESQVTGKSSYYQNLDPARKHSAWASSCWCELGDPFHVHNAHQYVSWLERFRGVHPAAMRRLWCEAKHGRYGDLCRGMGDVRRLMVDPLFRMVRLVLRRWPDEAALSRRGMTRYRQLCKWLPPVYLRYWRWLKGGDKGKS
jgi:hypothetical protein